MDPRKELMEAAQNYAEALQERAKENKRKFLELKKIAGEKSKELQDQLRKNDGRNAAEKLAEIKKLWSDAKLFESKAKEELTEALRLFEEALELKKALKLEEQ